MVTIDFKMRHKEKNNMLIFKNWIQMIIINKKMRHTRYIREDQIRSKQFQPNLANQLVDMIYEELKFEAKRTKNN